ncbi:MAG: oxidoreductase [Frankia sp.]|nr:oxidoreductase [Frankia sp.]
MGLVASIRRLGRIAEPAPPTTWAGAAPPDQASKHPEAGGGAEALPAALRGSLQLRHVDAGSCNGCEIEIGACFSPVYDAERYGARLVASPRHADGLLVTGVVTRNMTDALRDTVAATPEPRVVIAVGDCARDCGEFAGAYGVVGAVRDVVPVDAEVPGCPPPPDAIIQVLRQVTGR